MLYDPKRGGLICFEEPENGVHPLRLKKLINRLREMVTQPSENCPDPDASLNQLILNSHSPVALSGLEDSEMRFADIVSVVDPNSKTVRYKTRIRPVQPQLFADSKDHVTKLEVEQFLSTVERDGASE